MNGNKKGDFVICMDYVIGVFSFDVDVFFFVKVVYVGFFVGFVESEIGFVQCFQSIFFQIVCFQFICVVEVFYIICQYIDFKFNEVCIQVCDVVFVCVKVGVEKEYFEIFVRKEIIQKCKDKVFEVQVVWDKENVCKKMVQEQFFQ